ncbi:DUF1761 domain-containing protein [Demequina sp. B12]|uniref:DUF1761 domain-containing protein n=1 Tax=Demequina sp. B12 TaxID=2992757 RepID=UPI00237A3BD4|nr:DUF1761 domain-containing protein [Demequina sp. B12]MDE0573505.1 DUF1761 domain-containing protein [Demequina sp. B12]
MDWLSFSDISWLGVLLAFIATFVLGWLWYSPGLFFKPWQRAVGFTDEDMKDANMAASFGQMILGNALGVIALAVLFVPLGVDSWWAGLLTGAILGVVFRWGAHWVHDGFALRSPLATLIDGAHDTVALAAAGAILGAFL